VSASNTLRELPDDKRITCLKNQPLASLFYPRIDFCSEIIKDVKYVQVFKTKQSRFIASVPGVSRVFKRPEVDVRHALVGLHDHPDADVAVLLVLPEVDFMNPFRPEST
jgi:hypothetical protein